MGGTSISVTALLDDAADAARRVAAPWMGVLWLSALPCRFLQVHFLHQLGVLGDDARHHGRRLDEVAYATVAALILLLLGRAIFARACGLAGSSRSSPGREAWRVPPAAVAATLYTGLLAEAAFWAFLLTGIGPVVALVFAATAAAAAQGVERPGLVAPLRETVRGLAGLKAPVVFVVVFGLAVFLAQINLFVAAHAVLWVAGGVAGADLAGWEHLLRPAAGVLPWPAESLPRLLLWAGAVTAVEPFWLAAHVALFRRLRAIETGEDLRHWFEALRAEDVS